MTSRAELDRKFIAAVERLGQALRSARQQIATAHQISLLQLKLLERLADGEPRRVGELASELGVTQPTVSDALAVLDDKQIVSRGPDAADRRATAVALTASGARLAAEVAAELAPVVAAARITGEHDQAIALRVVLEEIRRLQINGVISVNRSCLSCEHYHPRDEAEPDWCELLGVQIGPADLRVDCPDHVEAAP